MTWSSGSGSVVLAALSACPAAGTLTDGSGHHLNVVGVSKMATNSLLFFFHPNLIKILFPLSLKLSWPYYCFYHKMCPFQVQDLQRPASLYMCAFKSPEPGAEVRLRTQALGQHGGKKVSHHLASQESLLVTPTPDTIWLEPQERLQSKLTPPPTSPVNPQSH